MAAPDPTALAHWLCASMGRGCMFSFHKKEVLVIYIMWCSKPKEAPLSLKTDTEAPSNPETYAIFLILELD